MVLPLYASIVFISGHSITTGEQTGKGSSIQRIAAKAIAGKQR